MRNIPFRGEYPPPFLNRCFAWSDYSKRRFGIANGFSHFNFSNLSLHRIIWCTCNRKNASEDSSISPLFGSWLSTLIIAPFALYFTQRASSDKGLINFDAIIVAFDPLISSIKNSIFATTEKIWKRKR